MKENIIPLSLIPCGKSAKVKAITAEGTLRRRMLDLGLVIDTIVKSLRKSPPEIQPLMKSEEQ